MKKLSYILMALVLVLGLAQCKKEQPKPQGEKVYITLKVGSDAKHTVNPATGKVYYTTGDKIYVGNHGKYIGTLTYDGSAFGGEITDPQTSDYLHFYFVGGLTPSAAPVAGTTTSFTVDISNQSSTLPVLSYVHTAEKYAGGTSYTCMLENKCGLVKFVPSSPTSATVTLNGVYNRATIDFATPGITPTGATGNIALYPAADDAKWAILLPQSGATATATIGGITYAIESFPNITNNYYNNTGVAISSSEVFNANTNPLTFEAMANDVTVKLHIFQTAQPSMQYRINEGDWTTLTFVDSYNSTSISLNTGDKLSFRGDNTTLTQDQNGYCRFECSGNCYVYGNIMSLLDKDNFPTKKTLSAGFTFYELFLNAPIYNHPSKTLVLPATTLTASCYADMFAGCTHLTTAPALPATTLASECYRNMFRGCTGLTTAPTLSATTLASECYREMFSGCTGLTTAPTLSATTLASGCYRGMFKGCTGLATAPALQAESLASDCYHEMFSGCTGLTTAPNLPATTAAENCYRYMFEDCTALATPPVLSATTMASHCYYAMFKGCTSLTTAPDLPATTLASYCYNNMFRGCTGLTTAPTILPATTLVDNCYRSMFDGCSELTTAPILPAATLQYYCYAWMFDGCTKLNSVTCLATNISADNCTYQWLNGVAATGSFTKAASMTGWTSGASGIPSDWTVKNAVPSGVLGGKFTVNAGGGQVSFSQGNLQFQASTSTWRFATNQYDFVGNATVGNVYENETKCNNANISNSYTGWIDLFGWGTGNNPTNSSTNNNDYGTFTDWGVNAISNGGNTADLWRTLSKDEWVYLFNTRTNAANLRTFATVNEVVGLILMPDGWTADGVSLTITTANYTSNIISLANWNTLESQGCVFLPSAGYRGGTTLDLVQDHGSYWSNTAYDSNNAYYLDVKTNGLDPQYKNNRYTGLSVRLVL